MATSIRVRCPVCGSLPKEVDLEDPKKPLTHRVEIVLQTFGGKVAADPSEPYSKHGVGKAHGLMKYEDITPNSPELFEKWTQWFAERVIEFGKANGLIE